MHEMGKPDSTQPGEDGVVSSNMRLQKALSVSYVLVALAGFVVLSVLAHSAPYLPLDLTITRAIQAFHPAWFVGLMIVISWPGYLPQAVIVTILFVGILFIAGLTWEAGMAAASPAVAEILDFSIKIFIQRPRPPASLVHVTVPLTTYSFPSGHVMFYTVFFGFLWIMAFLWIRPFWERSLALVVLGSLVALVGLSRVYLGEHWFTDVLGAYLLGSVVLLAAMWIYRWGRPRFAPRDRFPGEEQA